MKPVAVRAGYEPLGGRVSRWFHTEWGRALAGQDVSNQARSSAPLPPAQGSNQTIVRKEDRSLVSSAVGCEAVVRQ